MTRRKFSRKFKVEAVHVVTQRGASVAQAARDLEDEEVRRLRRGVAKLKAERDILRKAGPVLMFGFIVKHRGI